MGLFENIKQGLGKTRDNISKKIQQTLASFGKIDAGLFDELEEMLISCDIGMKTAMEITNSLKEKVKTQKLINPQDIKGLLKHELSMLLNSTNQSTLDLSKRPAVITVIGVNGVGKTTSIAKIAHMLKSEEGHKVILAAGDTFRAAAADQLGVWAKRAGVDMIRHEEGSDPAAVIFDAIQAAKARNADVLICDTAGRLHNKKNLMDELAKITRIIERELPGTSRETLLVLDATTGQNAMSQATEFSKITKITGIILAKLDGTARGGMVFSIYKELNIPVKYIGVGEQMDDLQRFDPDVFVNALFPEDEKW